MALMGDAAKLANKLVDEGKGVDKQVRRRSIARLGRDLRTVGGALGVLGGDPAAYAAGRRDRLVKRKGVAVPTVDAQIAARTEARGAKDFARADAIRAELAAMGVELLDRPDGTTDWRVRDDG
jgi:cysteinyl-tRNA synthetase